MARYHGSSRNQRRLYNSKEMFYNILEKNMIPVYDSARRQGYEIWDYS